MLGYQRATPTHASASTQEIELVTARHPQPVLHVGFIVSDLDAAMRDFQAALGIEW